MWPMKTLTALFLALFTTIAFAEDSARIHIGAFSFTRPAGWKSLKLPAVKPATRFTVPAPLAKMQGDTFKMSLLQVPDKDGGKPAVVAFRFYGMINDVRVGQETSSLLLHISDTRNTTRVEKEQFNGVKVTLISVEGTLRPAPMDGITENIPDAALLAAVLEHAKGAVFVKLMGPGALVKANREQFLEMVKSATGKK